MLGAYLDNRLVAVGGVNKDPYVPAIGVGRLRHVYVMRDARRLHVGTGLVRRIIGDAETVFSTLRLRTDTAAASAFYESLGFRETCEDSATHIIDPARYSVRAIS